MKFLKISATIFCLAASLTFVGCVTDTSGGGGDDCDSDEDCSDGERCFRQDGESFCVVPCTVDADCGGGESCQGGACLPGDANPDPNPTPGPGQPDPEPAPGPGVNPDPNPGPGPGPDPGLCTDACELLIECTDQACPGELGIGLQDCVAQCEIDPVEFQADLIVTLSCAEINDALCPAPPQETNTGEPCTSDADAQCGALQPFCFTEVDAMTGEESGFVGGYVTCVNCQDDNQCGEGNICVLIDQQNNTTICLSGCDPANPDCRDGYACPDLSMGQGVGACIPACEEDADCGEGGTCDVNTGQCN